MQILLANAKIMLSPTEVAVKPLTIPAFQTEADRLAKEMARLNLDELAEQLGCSRQLALENQQRYQNFFLAEKMTALMAYNGRAYQALKAPTLDAAALSFAQEHLFITCFLYGLLRPMDAIVPYRMEHTVRLEATNDKPIDRFWRDKLTDYLIRAVQADDGILIHLSTGEYERLFDWGRVSHEVKVIKPLFYVRRQGQLRMQAVWAKAGRGAMVRHLLQVAADQPAALADFAYEGFSYAPHLGEPAFPHFVREV
ncbi:YaaA family protein [Alloprevotella tannerae]|uniref:YaaA family protein n=1 Tax=Alloprevotella tannerae TaxID=76122 RepID=UPI0025EAFF0E|nr:YaaA family protein [Alloprevotella tannerae]